jgi:PAS domain-containing protein
MCEEEQKDNYELEVIDVYQQPELARQDQIVATPTLVKFLPLPVRRYIGNLSDTTGLFGGPEPDGQDPRGSMNTAPGLPASRLDLSRKLAELQARLDEANSTLRAIRSGEVDAVVVEGKQGVKIFTLEGAEYAYRVLIESMNEGALTLTADKMILYANQRFAGMVKLPLGQVIGGSFRRFLSVEDRGYAQVAHCAPRQGGGEVTDHADRRRRLEDSRADLDQPPGDELGEPGDHRHGGHGPDSGPAVRGIAAGPDPPRGAGAGGRARPRGVRTPRQHYPAALRGHLPQPGPCGQALGERRPIEAGGHQAARHAGQHGGGG